MDAAEAAVAHAQDVIARLCRAQNLRDQVVYAGGHLRTIAHRLERLYSIPVQTAAVAKRQIGLPQAPGQL